MKTVWRFLKKLKLDPYDPAVPLLGMHPKETVKESSVPSWLVQHHLQ